MRTGSLRAQAAGNLATAQQWADDSTFELLGGDARERLAARGRLQRAATDAQSVFLTQLALAHQRPAIGAMEVPESVVCAARRFDAVVGEYLDVVADRIQGRAHRDLPELRLPQQVATDRMQVESQLPATPEVAAQIEGRLSLYRELVPRLERLGSADLGE